MSLGKKILTIVLAIVLVAGIGVGVIFALIKDKGVSEADAKLSVSSTAEFLEETIGAIYETSQNQVSGSLSGNLATRGSINVSDTQYTTEKFTLENLMNILLRPAAFMYMADYMMRNDYLSFDKQLYGPWSEDDDVYYLHLARKDYGFTLSVTVPFEEDGYDGEYVLDVKYDYENKKPLNINAYNFYGDVEYISFNVEANKFYAFAFNDDNIIHSLFDKSKNITDSNISDYYYYGMLACYAEVDYDDFNLSRFDGFSVSTNYDIPETFDKNKVKLSQMQRNIFRECLQKFTEDFPTQESIKPSVVKNDSTISYLVEDAYWYASYKIEYNTSQDSNGNDYYYNRFEEYDVVKKHMTQINNIANTTKPLYGDKSYSAQGFDGTNEISIASFKGIMNGINSYLNSKNENSFSGIHYAEYGKYTFSLFPNSGVEIDETTGHGYVVPNLDAGSPLFKEMIDDNELLNIFGERYIANCIMATYNNEDSSFDSGIKYIYIIYVTDFNDNVIYINYRDYFKHGDTSATYFEYLNTSKNKGIMYGNFVLSQFGLGTGNRKYPILTADTSIIQMQEIMYVNGVSAMGGMVDDEYMESSYDRSTDTLDTLNITKVTTDASVPVIDIANIDVVEGEGTWSYIYFLRRYFPFGAPMENLIEGRWY